MASTIFDKILAGDVAADVVFENDSVLAFRDLAPQAPTHVLVIPKERMESLNDAQEMSTTVLGEFLRSIALVADRLGLASAGYRVVFNTGPDANQTVQYLHAHILAGRTLSWPPG